MYQTGNFKINPSSSHKYGWVFTEINGNGWFMIYSSEKQIEKNYGSSR